MFRKKNNRIISIILVVLISLLMISTFSMAEKEEKVKWEGDTVNYVSLGDSIATGDAIIPTNAFPEQLKKAINGRATNLARSGATTKDLLDSLNMIGDNPFGTSDINAIKKADVITISIGGNNLLSAIYGPVGNVGINLETGVELFYHDWPIIIEDIRTLNKTADIYVLNLYNPFNESIQDGYQYEAGLYSLIELAVKAVNDKMDNIYFPLSDPPNQYVPPTSLIYNVVDVYTTYKYFQPSNIGDITYMYPYNPLERDIHPNQDGQNIMFELIMDKILLDY